MIAIVDYSLGNVYSVRRSLEYLGLDSIIERDPEALRKADRIILPGVGAFRDAIRLLDERGLGEAVRERAAAGVPLLGLCLGMQLLFKKSFEFGEFDGLGLLTGEIHPIREDIPSFLKVPQIGWNALHVVRDTALTRSISECDYVYYVHSYYAKFCGDAVSAVSEYGVEIPGIVECGNVMGCQFHPEKSGSVGLSILKAFSEVEE